MDRRRFLAYAAAVPIGNAAGVGSAPSIPASAPEGSNTFGFAAVRTMARNLAAQPYRTPNRTLPPGFDNLTYQQYRSIRFRKERALWRDDKLPFQVEFFHLGFIYHDPVEIYEVKDRQAIQIPYSSGYFTFGDALKPRAKDGNLGFAGFRIHAPFNRVDYYDEVCAFLGASYFRAVAKGQGYGLSARGLAIKTADPTGEEFPVFRSFWIKRPPLTAHAITVYALLDSPSTSGAFQFSITPGEETVFDVEASLYPRVNVTKIGIAPLTSMFYFAANDRTRADDYREAVHDSGGLLLLTQKNEQIWRPLTNPRQLQFSVFEGAGPRGFGLMQRKRTFAAYDDLEAHYENRPSLWIEPREKWGDGAVDLVEIPTADEINDNIVAFWRPKQPLKAKQTYDYRYRMHWCWRRPQPASLARTTDTRSGADRTGKTRLFVLDFEGEVLKGIPAGTKLAVQLNTTKGNIINATTQPNPETGGWRLSFQLDPQGSDLAEIYAKLMWGNAPVSETWVYRWTR